MNSSTKYWYVCAGSMCQFWRDVWIIMYSIALISCWVQYGTHVKHIWESIVNRYGQSISIQYIMDQLLLCSAVGINFRRGRKGLEITCVNLDYCAILCNALCWYICMLEHVGCGLNMFKQRLNVCKWVFIPWLWPKQDAMPQVCFNKCWYSHRTISLTL